MIFNFQKQAILLFKKLKEKTNATFSISETEKFINSFNSNTLKAKSTDKSDIKVVIHDQRTAGEPEQGFSIKSQLGSASTLLNPDKTTNFVYKISNVQFTRIDEINKIDTQHKVQYRLLETQKEGEKIKFEKMENKLFSIESILC